MRRVQEKDFPPESGKVRHPHRHWYMNLAVKIVDTVNERVDDNLIPRPRKAMILGMSLDLDGIWGK